MLRTGRTRLLREQMTQQDRGRYEKKVRTKMPPHERLLRGGHVISMDPNIGDIPGGDVLIE